MTVLVQFAYSVTTGNEFEGSSFEERTVRLVEVFPDRVGISGKGFPFLVDGEREVLFFVGGEVHGMDVHGLVDGGFAQHEQEFLAFVADGDHVDIGGFGQK